MSTNRVLITGASGLLGRAILKEFEQSDRWDALGLAYSRAKGNLKKVDITDPKQVRAAIEEFKPTVIIHSAAERRPDVVDKQEEATKVLNVTATETICKIAAEQKIFVLYISTDYVFDGTNPPYRVSDTPNPINKYGGSKLEGERVTMEASEANMVLRVSMLYGPVECLEECAVTVLFKNVKSSTDTCMMSNYERRFPTDVRDISGVIRQLLEKRAEDPSLTGYFHWSSEDNMTKYDMALAMAEVFSLPAAHITADNKASPGAPRPYDVHLDSSRIEKLGICVRTPFKEGIESCLREFVEKYY